MEGMAAHLRIGGDRLDGAGGARFCRFFQTHGNTSPATRSGKGELRTAVLEIDTASRIVNGTVKEERPLGGMNIIVK